jgi:hypothetical protein
MLLVLFILVLFILVLIILVLFILVCTFLTRFVSFPSLCSLGSRVESVDGMLPHAKGTPVPLQKSVLCVVE